ncbi:hypothetical protein AYO21_00009 [Fonsecaea monophora]|uniref:Pre-mRNA-splicing factor n=1 Tax=Fonsecaea monophora TaxID=254056 RepID=A0A177FM84_9EURO|nr:hypothetical protein AYO21_00009 [Fonsecaea monophora]OAG45375.1 hypothetical protein AYO21_00009 [Fonsecaea monophora]
MKPISFGLGKPKGAAPAQSAGTTSRKTHTPSSSRLSRTALRHDSDNEDEEEPRHESVSGFSSSGAILSQPLQDSQEKVIPNAGNADWRRQGRKNLLPAEVQAQQQNGNGVVVVERDEVSKASGLQFAEKDEEEREHQTNGSQQSQEEQPATQPKQLTADEEALQALLDDGSGKPRSNAVITIQGNRQLSPQDETQDFREDVASRPDSSTLEEYAAMPVEEFGMAMLRGMGQKRRANGEIIDLAPKNDDNPRKLRKQEGFLGIGAKAAPGSDIELGAWGKADMRKNTKGQGFFTPLMRENKATGERISEDEFQKRLKESSNAKQEEEWKQRRDRNLEISALREATVMDVKIPVRGATQMTETTNAHDRDVMMTDTTLVRPIEVIGTGTGTETEIEIETGTEKKTETVTEIGTEIETETATVATGTDNVGLVGKENREVFGQMESLHA